MKETRRQLPSGRVYCDTCRKDYVKHYERGRCKDRIQKNNFKRRYGITPEQYQQLLEMQNFKCAVCAIDSKQLKRRLSVDHNHTTKAVRGLLCAKCNTAIGLVGESIEVITNMINYLEKYAKC